MTALTMRSLAWRAATAAVTVPSNLCVTGAYRCDEGGCPGQRHDASDGRERDDALHNRLGDGYALLPAAKQHEKQPHQGTEERWIMTPYDAYNTNTRYIHTSTYIHTYIHTSDGKSFSFRWQGISAGTRTRERGCETITPKRQARQAMRRHAILCRFE